MNLSYYLLFAMENTQKQKIYAKIKTTHFENKDCFEAFLNQLDIEKIEKKNQLLVSLLIMTDSGLRIEFEKMPSQICGDTLTVGKIRIYGENKKFKIIKHKLRENTCYRKGDSVGNWWKICERDN